MNPCRISVLPDGPYLVCVVDPVGTIVHMGGTLALAAQRGIRVVPFVLGAESDGEEQIRKIRRAFGVLGVVDIVCFGVLEDSQDFPLIEKELASLLREVLPRTVFAPSCTEYGHEYGFDSKSISWVTIHKNLEKFNYTGRFGRYTGGGDWETNSIVDITPVVELKKKALGIIGHKGLNPKTAHACELRNRVRGIPEAVKTVECYHFFKHCNAQTREMFDSVELVLSERDLCKRLLQGQIEREVLHSRLVEYQHNYQRVTASLSWKITRPLRMLKQIYNGRYHPDDSRFLKGLAFLRKNGIKQTVFKVRQVYSGRENPYRDYCKRNVSRRHDPANLSYKPLISILLPVFNPPHTHLRACLDSVLHQVYSNWELCIADDASTDTEVKQILSEYARKLPAKIKLILRERNGHICAATNSALYAAGGEYIALLDHDDMLHPDALLEIAVLLNEHPDADMVYTDEDKVDEKGQFSEPYFKPDWQPDLLMGQMYTCHLSVYRRSIVTDLGGFRQGVEGAQDHDLALRVTEKTDKVHHIPRILYHWRKSSVSCSANPASKNYAYTAGMKVVNDALVQRGEGGWAEPVDNHPGCYLVHYPVTGRPLISIIILTRDQPQLLDRCLLSIFEKSSYPEYEILLIDNGSRNPDSFALFQKWRQILPDRFRIKRLDIPFNFSRLNNEGVKTARGDILLLLNNDTEVLSPRWLDAMAGYARRKSIGAVGAFLLYPDRSVQHAGIILGITGTPKMPGVAGHGHKYFPADSSGYFSRLKIVSNYSAVTGACLMVERRIYEEVGGLDESIGVAFNDVDFCLKLMEKGYRNVVLPHVKLIHHESKSRGHEDNPEKQQRFQKEISIMLQRWQHRLTDDPCYNPNLTFWQENFNIKGEEELRS